LDEYGLAAPEYPGHRATWHHGLCYRGHFISELVNHPSRLHEATIRDRDRPQAVPPGEALRRAADILPAMHDELAVVIDGNLPCEELAGAVRLARQGLDINQVAIFIPPADEAVLRGLATSSAPCLGEEPVAGCDVILAVGDPFATHPLIASPALDAVAKARGHRLVNIDSLRGRTARFSADFCQVRPGGEAAALAGLLCAMSGASSVGALAELDVSKAAEMAGAPAGSLEKLASAVQAAKKLGVLISLPEGRCAAASAAAALAAKVAEARGGGICPLLAYGNAVGARRIAASLQATPLAQLLVDMQEGKVKKLLVLGTDVVSAAPWAELASVEIVVAASPMPSATTARARIVLPMGFWFELGGTALDGAGVQRKAEALAAPPRGALAPTEVLRRLGASVSGEAMPEGELDNLLKPEPTVDLAEVLGSPSEWAASSAEGQLTIVSQADAKGFADGSVTTQLAWPAVMEPYPVLRVNPREAHSLASDAVTLRSDGVAVTLPVEPSDDVPPGVGAVSPRFPETRVLFTWSKEGVGPGLVSISGPLENSG